VNIICSSNSTSPELMKLISAVLYVSWTMGLTCCYKTEGFYTYICTFSTISYDISISDTCLRSRKSISKPNFHKISQSTAEIKLLPVSENGRPPYWNSVSCYDFDESIVIGMSFYICLPNLGGQSRKCTSGFRFSLPNFVVIRRLSAKLWRQSTFQDGRRQPYWIWSG